MEKIEQPLAGRLLSLDVFRGFTIFFMIMVNNSGSGRYTYWALEHAKWNGLTPTDLVFPFFLFISGASIFFALSKKKESGIGIQDLRLTILKRGLTIILIGIIVHSLPGPYELAHFNWERFFRYMRYPGVLQRIGLVYIIVSLLFLSLEIRTLKILAFVFLALYYVLMVLVPVPGVGVSSLEPAMNLEAWLDRFIIGSHHLYQNTYFWDPEGILSTLPAISTGLFGLLAGNMLKSKAENSQKLKYLLQNGTIYLALGIIINFTLFPSNKNLWSSSFVLITAGLASLILGLLFFLIDMRKNTQWTQPLVYYGVNSILIYIIAESMETVFSFIQLPDGNGRTIDLFHWIYLHVFNPLFSSPYFTSMLWSFFYALLYLPLVWFFYKKKIFLKV